MPLFINKFVTFSFLFFFQVIFFASKLQKFISFSYELEIEWFQILQIRGVEIFKNRSIVFDEKLCLMHHIYVSIYFFDNLKKIQLFPYLIRDLSTSMLLYMIFHQTQLDLFLKISASRIRKIWNHSISNSYEIDMVFEVFM